MSSCKKEYILEQQTPMIHFQYDEQGVCLRASEVKPKLDKFIVKQVGGREKILNDHQDWLLGDIKNLSLTEGTPFPLNYKLIIRATGEPQRSNTVNKAISAEIKREASQRVGAWNNEEQRKKKKEIDEEKNIIIKQLIKKNILPADFVKENEAPIAKSYFGNMVSRKGSIEETIESIRKSYKETVFQDNISMSINCFNKSLMQTIEELIPAFFLLHNFGTRQNKGFGSFKLVSDAEYDVVKTIAKYAPASIYAKDIYKMGDYNNALEDIVMVYNLMKSGINYTNINKNKNMNMNMNKDDYFRGFIYRYFHKKELGNDKAFVKQKVIPHKYSVLKGESLNGFKEYRYVRGMLGINDGVYYRDVNEQTSTHSEDGIERFASPIIFKYIDKSIFLIPQEIPAKMFNTTFYIWDSKTENEFKKLKSDDEKKLFFDKNKKFRIKTPKREEFSIDEFMESFMNDFNDKKTAKGGRIGIEGAKNSAFDRLKNIIFQSVLDEKGGKGV